MEEITITGVRHALESYHQSFCDYHQECTHMIGFSRRSRDMAAFASAAQSLQTKAHDAAAKARQAQNALRIRSQRLRQRGFADESNLIQLLLGHMGEISKQVLKTCEDRLWIEKRALSEESVKGNDPAQETR